MELETNIRRVRERIESACARSGRRPQDVRLVAVSKTVAPEVIRTAYECGLREFGENRVQEAEAKRAVLAGLGVVWHLIGHLQTNKAKTARQLFQWIHSVDSLRLAEKLHLATPAHEVELPVLLEVKLGDEPTKFGVPESGILKLAEEVSALPSLRLCGLMTIPPYFDDPEQVRPFFRRLRELAQRVESAGLANVSMRELSMGMSHDLEAAIEEGATIVRVGTAIFGERP